MAKTKIETPAGCLGVLAFFVALGTLSTVINGWALATLWRWFITTTFAAPALTTTQAIGLAVFFSLLSPNKSDVDEDDKDLMHMIVSSTSKAVLRPVLALCIGWVVLQFM